MRISDLFCFVLLEINYPNGDHYEGEFKDGEFHGRGILHYANGAKYEAIWEKGIAKDV